MIGIMDWGIGGLSVYKAMRNRGLTTDVLCTMVPRLTAVEVHDELAAELAARFDGTNVTVMHADATHMALPNDRFSAAVCLTMLHHLPSAEHQDALFAELHRVLRPGGALVGQDSLASDELRALHVGDTYVPVDSGGLSARLVTYREADADAVAAKDGVPGSFIDAAAAMDVILSHARVEKEPSHSHSLRNFSASSRN